MGWYGPIPVSREEYEESELNEDYEDTLLSTDQAPIHDIREDSNDLPSQSESSSRDNGGDGGDGNGHDTGDGENRGDSSNGHTVEEQADQVTLDQNMQALSPGQVSQPPKTPDTQKNPRAPDDTEDPNGPSNLNGSENDQSGLQTRKVAGRRNRKAHRTAAGQKPFSLSSTSKGSHLHSWNTLDFWSSGCLMVIGTGIIALGIAMYAKERRSLRP